MVGLTAMIFVAVFFLPEDVHGANETVEIGGVSISGYNDNTWHAFNSGKPAISGWTKGQYKLSSDRQTLYLNEMQYTGTRTGIKSTGPLTIVLTGSSTFNCGALGIELHNETSYENLTIKNDGSDGCSLTFGGSNNPTIDVNGLLLTSGNISTTGQIYCRAYQMIRGGTIIARTNTIGSALQISGGRILTNGEMNIGEIMSATGGLIFAGTEITVKTNAVVSGTTVKAERIYVKELLKITGGSVYAETAENDWAIGSGSFSMTDGKLHAKNKKVEDRNVQRSPVNLKMTPRVGRIDLADDIWASKPEMSERDRFSTANGEFTNEVILQKVKFISVNNNIRPMYVGEKFSPGGLLIDIHFEDGSVAGLGPTGHVYGSTEMFIYRTTDGRILDDNYILKEGNMDIEITCLSKKTTTRITVKKFPSLKLNGTASEKSTRIEWNGIVGEMGRLSRVSEYRLYARDEGEDEFTPVKYQYNDSYGSYRFPCDPFQECTEYEDRGLYPGTTREYYVEAKVGENDLCLCCSTESAYTFKSDILKVTSPIDAPTVDVRETTYDTIALQWAKVRGAEEYEIFRASNVYNFGSIFVHIDTTDECSYTDVGLTEGKEYRYRVKASKPDRNLYSKYSNLVTAKTKTRPVPATKPKPTAKPPAPPKKEEPDGAAFNLLQARATKVSNKSVTLTWKAVKGAKKYIVYGNKCGKKNKYKKLLTTTKKSTVFKKVNGFRVAKGTYYKFSVSAIGANGKVISVSKTIHVATTGGKWTNDRKVTTTAKKNRVVLKKGKIFNLKAKAIPASKKKKVDRHRKVAYESSNKKIATVSSKGVIKAKKKGTCYVFAYAQNGLFSKIKVTVK